MAKKDKQERVATQHGVYVENGKFHCVECEHEMNVGDVCPTCHKQVEWDRVVAELRSRGLG